MFRQRGPFGKNNIQSICHNMQKSGPGGAAFGPCRIYAGSVQPSGPPVILFSFSFVSVQYPDAQVEIQGKKKPQQVGQQQLPRCFADVFKK